MKIKDFKFADILKLRKETTLAMNLQTSYLLTQINALDSQTAKTAINKCELERHITKCRGKYSRGELWDSLLCSLPLMPCAVMEAQEIRALTVKRGLANIKVEGKTQNEEMTQCERFSAKSNQITGLTLHGWRKHLHLPSSNGGSLTLLQGCMFLKTTMAKLQHVQQNQERWVNQSFVVKKPQLG